MVVGVAEVLVECGCRCGRVFSRCVVVGVEGDYKAAELQ